MADYRAHGRSGGYRIGPAAGTSIVFHCLLLLAAVAVFRLPPSVVVEEPLPIEYQVVFVQEPGPGGGGGGSPEPAPPKPLELPRLTPREPAPVMIKPLVLDVPPVVPALNAPVYVNDASVVQASGRSTISLSAFGAGGSGGGVGEGKGSGVGEGEGGGFGGDAYRPGSGALPPELLHSEKPDYTSAAMLAKIQGQVELEVVVQADGTVGDVRIVRALGYGLDEQAIRAGRLWRFRPATLDGEPIAMIVTLVLSFRLH